MCFITKYFRKKEKFTEEQIKRINKFKSKFRLFFEGIPHYKDPVFRGGHSNLILLGITDLSFDFLKNNIMNVKISSELPGLLIGKGGETIDHLVKYLSDENNKIKITVEESKLWSPHNNSKI